jgi:hypothetical protein
LAYQQTKQAIGQTHLDNASCEKWLETNTPKPTLMQLLVVWNVVGIQSKAPGNSMGTIELQFEEEQKHFLWRKTKDSPEQYKTTSAL